MRIGIDFDNTISNYDDVLYKTAIKEKYISKNSHFLQKNQIKKEIIKKGKSLNNWKKLQGLIYGQYMLQAQLNSGFANFVKLSNSKNYEIVVVSHKTIYGHFDKKKIQLRKKALYWMKKNKFFDKRYFGINIKNIYFEPTLKKK